MDSFKKTRIMNIGGAIIFALLGFSGFFLQIFNTSEIQFNTMLTETEIIYLFLSILAFSTANALAETSSLKLQKLTLWLNSAVVAFLLLYLIFILVNVPTPEIYKQIFKNHSFFIHYSWLLGLFALYIIPPSINIFALRSKLSESKGDHYTLEP